MPIRQRPFDTGAPRRGPAAGGPLVDVLLGAENDAPVGLVHVRVAPGGAMPEHDHGVSSVVLIPLAGTAQLIDVADGDRVIPLAQRTVTTVPIGRRVRLENPGTDEAELLVVVAPADFARELAGWPAAA